MIVPLEKQVASLELMQELIGLGLKVESLFYHQQIHQIGTEYKWKILSCVSHHAVCHYPAYTVAELGELLKGLTVNIIAEAMGNVLDRLGSSAMYLLAVSIGSVGNADFWARVIIWLIKNNHVTVEELNR